MSGDEMHSARAPAADAGRRHDVDRNTASRSGSAKRHAAARAHGEFPHDGQSQSAPVGDAVVNAAEALEHALSLVERNARASSSTVTVTRPSSPAMRMVTMPPSFA
jgi:hypothetical protein